jgi:hypothetical protein
MPCEWYVRGGGEGMRRILIGQSVPPTPFGMTFGSLSCHLCSLDRRVIFRPGIYLWVRFPHLKPSYEISHNDQNCHLNLNAIWVTKKCASGDRSFWRKGFLAVFVTQDVGIRLKWLFSKLLYPVRLTKKDVIFCLIKTASSAPFFVQRSRHYSIYIL